MSFPIWEPRSKPILCIVLVSEDTSCATPIRLLSGLSLNELTALCAVFTRTTFEFLLQRPQNRPKTTPTLVTNVIAHVRLKRPKFCQFCSLCPPSPAYSLSSPPRSLLRRSRSKLRPIGWRTRPCLLIGLPLRPIPSSSPSKCVQGLWYCNND